MRTSSAFFASHFSLSPLPFPPASSSARTSPAAPRVLIVDDDEDDQFFIKQAFTQCGQPCQLFSANDGIDCLQFLGENNQLPDLILLDLNMPKLNGFEVLRHLQATPHWQNLPVVVVSTNCDEQTQQIALALGAEACMAKPNRQADYQALVSQLYTRYL